MNKKYIHRILNYFKLEELVTIFYKWQQC